MGCHSYDIKYMSADEPTQTCRKIVNWRQYLRFPEEVPVPPLARDLICRLLCDVEQRLGSHGGAAEIKVNGMTIRLHASRAADP